MSREWRVLGQGRHATVLAVPGGHERSARSAMKVVSAPRSGRTLGSQPHDVAKEVRILRAMQHPNIISLEDNQYDDQLLEHHLCFPLLPLSLRNMLDKRERFEDDLLQSVIFQCLLGLAHLHGSDMAHRDIKPDNVMIDWDGTIKLIDFGTAWVDGDQEGEELPWRETKEDMCCSVGSGHYRPPELLFSPTCYDPFAIDIWALGVVITDCMGPSIFPDEDLDIDDGSGSRDSDSSSDDPLEDSGRASPPHTGRTKLFNDTYGDAGLAASIFRLLGTPTDDNWPDFPLLPDAGKIEFVECSPRSLETFFPHAPARLLDLAKSMLCLDPRQRSSAVDAVRHPYLHETLVPSLRKVWFGIERRVDLTDQCVEVRNGSRLVDLLRPQLDDERLKWDIPSLSDEEV